MLKFVKPARWVKYHHEKPQRNEAEATYVTLSYNSPCKLGGIAVFKTKGYNPVTHMAPYSKNRRRMYLETYLYSFPKRSQLLQCSYVYYHEPAGFSNQAR